MTKNKKPSKPISNPPSSSSATDSGGLGLSSSTPRPLVRSLTQFKNSTGNKDKYVPLICQAARKNRIKEQGLSEIHRAAYYWNSISDKEKLGFLEVSIKSLMDFFSSIDGQKGFDFLQRAIPFAEANSTWNFWVCFDCRKEFGDRDSLSCHTIKDHLCSALSELPMMLCQQVPMSQFSDDWKPIDIPSAKKILQGGNWGSEESFLPSESERTQLLGRILGLFKLLWLSNCLTWSLIKDLLIYAKDEAGDIGILDDPLDCLKVYICILDAPQLNEIVDLLMAIELSCGSDTFHVEETCWKENPSATASAKLVGHKFKDLDGVEWLKFQLNQSKLQLDSSSLKGKFVPDADALLYWLYPHTTMSDPLSAWSNVFECRWHECKKILVKIKKGFSDFVRMAEAKLELLQEAKPLLALCENQAWKPLGRSHAVIVRERQVELAEMESIVTILTSSKSIALKPCDSSKTLEDNGASSSGSSLLSQAEQISILSELDDCAQSAIRTTWDHIVVKINMIDARIRQNLHILHQLIHAHIFDTFCYVLMYQAL